MPTMWIVAIDESFEEMMQESGRRIEEERGADALNAGSTGSTVTRSGNRQTRVL